MYTKKSVMEIEAEKCKGVPTVREKAEANKKAVVAITAELDKFKL